MVATQTQISLGPIVWVMVSVCVLAMILMIVALLALSRDKKKSPNKRLAYLHRNLYAGMSQPMLPKERAEKSSRTKVTVFPGNVSRVRWMANRSQAAEAQADKEVM